MKFILIKVELKSKKIVGGFNKGREWEARMWNNT